MQCLRSRKRGRNIRFYFVWPAAPSGLDFSSPIPGVARRVAALHPGLSIVLSAPARKNK
jgi:hypothetical protein